MSPSRRQLRLHHELLLLALHDREGTVAFGRMHTVGLAGCAFAELVMAEKVAIRSEPVGRRGRVKQRVEVVDGDRMGEQVLDAALDRLKSAKRPAAPSAAVGRVARIKKFRAMVARELVQRGIVRATEQEILLFFRRRVYPTLDPGPERALVSRIRAALEGGEPPDARTALLVGIARPTGMLRAIYDRRELRSLKGRIDEVATLTGAVGESVDEAIQAVQAAVVAATTAAVSAASS